MLLSIQKFAIIGAQTLYRVNFTKYPELLRTCVASLTSVCFVPILLVSPHLLLLRRGI